MVQDSGGIPLSVKGIVIGPNSKTISVMLDVPFTFGSMTLGDLCARSIVVRQLTSSKPTLRLLVRQLIRPLYFHSNLPNVQCKYQRNLCGRTNSIFGSLVMSQESGVQSNAHLRRHRSELPISLKTGP